MQQLKQRQKSTMDYDVFIWLMGLTVQISSVAQTVLEDVSGLDLGRKFSETMRHLNPRKLTMPRCFADAVITGRTYPDSLLTSVPQDKPHAPNHCSIIRPVINNNHLERGSCLSKYRTRPAREYRDV